MKPRKITLSDGVLWLGDCVKVMNECLPEKCVDLVVGSPPYEDQRLYLEDGKDLGIARATPDWVAWMAEEVFPACLRVSKGIVAMVVGHGKGAKTWSGAPALLCAALLARGVNLRRPLIYKRNSIMGSGGPDWFRADFEWIICAGPRDLEWSDNTACGAPPKCPLGGRVSHRNKDGMRVNAALGRTVVPEVYAQLNALMAEEGLSKKQAALRLGIGQKQTTNAKGGCNLSNPESGARVSSGVYIAPERANPGDVIDCGSVGGGHLGSNIAHENEAPYPVQIPIRFIRSFCPPDGTVLDPFGGSGTTLAEAVRLRRRFISIDQRPSQIRLMLRRYKQATLRKGLI